MNKVVLGVQWSPSTKLNSEDKAAGFDHKGCQYRVIEKRDGFFSSLECSERGFLGVVVAVICTLFLELFAKPVQDLFIKPKENISRDPLVSPQKTNHVNPSLPTDVSLYTILKKEMEQEGSTLYVADETGKHAETLLRVLGKGGSKKAFEVGRGRALILPNMDADSAAVVARRWERIVLEEVELSKIFNRLGLLSPLSKQVSITLTESSEHVIPAYISETFESFSLKGLFIIDTKNADSSTWKEGERFLFKSDEERLIEKNWDSVLDPVLTDIAKICLYDIPASKDSLNVAILKKSSDSAVCQYEVRYFGFDFSSKHGFLTIPDSEHRSSASPNMDKATGLLDGIIENVFSSEFGDRYDDGDESVNLKNLKDRLVQKYIKDIAARMNS
jgi:hypothetical protein